MSGKTVLATGTKTIINLSNNDTISVYLTTNHPAVQVYDENTNVFLPDWEEDGAMTIIPSVYINQKETALSNVSVTWTRKHGSGQEEPLSDKETVSNGILTISNNILGSFAAGQITYLAKVIYRELQAKAEMQFTLVRTGKAAKTVWISGPQVFKYAAESDVPTPQTVTLTANTQNTNIVMWQYRNNENVWKSYPVSSRNQSISDISLVVSPEDSVWHNDVADIRVLTEDDGVEDIASVYKIRDGAPGSDGTSGASSSIVLLSNDHVVFTADENGIVQKDTSFSVHVVAYTGTEKIIPSFTLGKATDGIQTTINETLVDNEKQFTILVKAGTALGGSEQASGEIDVCVSAPITTTLKLYWSKINQGKTGADGLDGEDAAPISFSLFTPDGTVVRKNQGGLRIMAIGYDGSTKYTDLETSSVSFVWKKWDNDLGDWQTLPDTGNEIVANGTEIIGTASYLCAATYQDKTYQAIVSLIDKTDATQAEIDSSAGNMLLPNQNETYLTCRIRQAGMEIDPIKTTSYGTSLPTVGMTVGDYFYQTEAASESMTLYQYQSTGSGNAWVNVTNKPEGLYHKIYRWYRRNQDGMALDTTVPYAEGKLIRAFVDGENEKLIFCCKVTSGDTIEANAEYTITKQDALPSATVWETQSGYGSLTFTAPPDYVLKINTAFEAPLNQSTGTYTPVTELTMNVNNVAYTQKLISADGTQLAVYAGSLDWYTGRLEITKKLDANTGNLIACNPVEVEDKLFGYISGSAIRTEKSDNAQKKVTNTITGTNIGNITATYGVEYASPSDLDNQINEALENYRTSLIIDNDGVKIKKKDSPFDILITNDEIEFRNEEQALASINGNALDIPNAVIDNLTVTATQKIGNFEIACFEDGSFGVTIDE